MPAMSGAEEPAGRGGPVPAVVSLRPIASGLPFGFFGLVIAATIVGAQALGVLPPSASVAIGLVLLPTVLLQLIGGVSCILGRDVISASLMLTFCGVWLGTALVYIAHPPDGLAVLAIWYLGLAPVIMALISTATGKLALTVVPVVGLPTFVVTAVWLLGGAGSVGLGRAVGIMSFVLAAAALYSGLALLFEDSRRRTILPTLRRGPMKTAFTGTLSDQLVDVEHEAGVRRYI
jgi:uncharacterized protein